MSLDLLPNGGFVFLGIHRETVLSRDVDSQLQELATVMSPADFQA